jgi:predicted PurR-regulated permease PerM
MENPESRNTKYLQIAIELILKIGSLFLVVYLCYRILAPFLSILLWGLIISIILFPLYRRLFGWLGNRKKLASAIITILSLAILVMPSIWLVNQLVDGARYLAVFFVDGNLGIPPPSESVRDWPYIGDWFYEHWMQASRSSGESLNEFLPRITTWGEKLLVILTDTGKGILQFAVSFIIAGVFLYFYKWAELTGLRLFRKVAGNRGDEFFSVTLFTIRNVAFGVVGVAIIQTTIMGLGLIIAGIPLAAIWIIVLLIMTIAQIPVLIFNVFLIIYLFAYRDPLPAALWTVFFVLAGLIDNYLKPLIMGKGATVPMLVVFVGAIGGFLSFGFIGLFLGSIILSLAYKLYIKWVATSSEISI